MIDRFTHSDLQQLVANRTGPCTSIYLPTPRIGSDALQNRIQLKNAMAEVCEQLQARGLSRAHANEYLRPIEAVAENRSLWDALSTGIAIFRSAETFRFWRLPQAFKPFVWVARRFYVTPLLSLAAQGENFYLLAIGQKGAKLFAGSVNELREIEVKALPASLADALQLHPPEGLLQVRTVSTAMHGKEGAVFHGQGAVTRHPKDDILVYFRVVDAALHDFLKGKTAPLVFAGVGYLFPIYCRANTYPHLFEESITGNVANSSLEVVHRRACELLQPVWRRRQSEDLLHIRHAAGSEMASTDLKEVLRVAHEGRIAALFVAADAQHWGRFDPAIGLYELADSHDSHSEDLLNLAVCTTLACGGRVYAVKPAELPDHSLACALFRYSPVEEPSPVF